MLWNANRKVAGSSLAVATDGTRVSVVDALLKVSRGISSIRSVNLAECMENVTVYKAKSLFHLLMS